MRTKKVLQTIDVMTESVVKELNDMSEKIESFDKRLDAEVIELANAINRDRENINDASDKYDFLIKTIIEQNKQMNDLIDIVDNKPNKSDVQTIAKHVQNLEREFNTVNMENAKSFRDLESRVADLEKEKCNCNPNEIILFHTRIEKAKLQTDYFLKAKNLLIEYAEKTMIKKGIEYTPVGDRFANFRPILGEKQTALEKLIGYNAKHVQYCFMQNENPNYPSDTYKRENTAIGYIFGFGENRKDRVHTDHALAKYNKWISMQRQIDDEGGDINYQTFDEWINKMICSGRVNAESIRDPYSGIPANYIREYISYYKQCYIDELLEHWGDVFNYNVLGLAMENTDRSKAFVVPYADRETQEKEIKDIVNGTKHFTEYNSELSKDELYSQLLNHIKESNLNYIIFLFAKQLERLENSK